MAAPLRGDEDQFTIIEALALLGRWGRPARTVEWRQQRL